jgi:hypothetical protein
MCGLPPLPDQLPFLDRVEHLMGALPAAFSLKIQPRLPYETSHRAPLVRPNFEWF